ncbi:MAG: ABC-F family ATP-binding cassette domain-containing protein [Clostridia bacterium]|nr:ABC-F family ATP-binding cassette domain-containing protein [Clostridia bacterium]
MTEFSLNHIYKNFGFKPILKDLSFEIMSGERAALVGRNGTGKSTILKLLSGLETPDSGEISIRRGAGLTMLEQIPRLRPLGFTVRDVLLESFSDILETDALLRALEAQMAEAPEDWERLTALYDEAQSRYTSLGGYDMEARMQKIVQGFRLNDLLDQQYNVLSGGQKTVVNLAACVLKEPDILLLDEPTNHLDMETLEWFEQFLSRYRGTVLIVSHDRWFLDRVATRTVILEGGTCQSFSGNYSFAVKEQERLMLIEFEQYKNQQKKIDAMRAAIKRYREWGAQADNEKFFRKAKTLELRLEKMELLDRPQLEKPKLPIAFSGARTGHDVLKLEQLSLSFGENRLLENASLLVEEKDRICLMGGNGTGKTSLLRAVLGDVPVSGRIVFNPGVQLGYIPQEIRFPVESDTVLEAFRRECVSNEGEARSILARYFFFGSSVFKSVSSLSGGEKVLLKLCILLQNQVNLLILDEPTNHIDIETREMLEEALLEFSGTLLFVSHDRFFIDKIATKLALLQNRRLDVFDGTYNRYMEFQNK